MTLKDRNTILEVEVEKNDPNDSKMIMYKLLAQATLVGLAAYILLHKSPHVSVEDMV